MQRVRIGLTGLAFVFVLVLLGTIFTRASEEESLTPNVMDRRMAPGAAAEAEKPKEPLAELGVAPGNADSNSTQGAATNEAAPAPR